MDENSGVGVGIVAGNAAINATGNSAAAAAAALNLEPPFPWTPYTVIVDSREQRGYTFAQPLAWSPKKKFTVQTKVAMLASGDYSLAGYEADVAVERKSLADCFSTLGQGRMRFQRELERLAAMKFAAVVVEAEWSRILTDPPRHSRLNPKTVFLSIVAWTQRYPAIHWFTMPNRAVGEATTIRILDRFWRERNAT